MLSRKVCMLGKCTIQNNVFFFCVRVLTFILFAATSRKWCSYQVERLQASQDKYLSLSRCTIIFSRCTRVLPSADRDAIVSRIWPKAASFSHFSPRAFQPERAPGFVGVCDSYVDATCARKIWSKFHLCSHTKFPTEGRITIQVSSYTLLGMCVHNMTDGMYRADAIVR